MQTYIWDGNNSNNAELPKDAMLLLKMFLQKCNNEDRFAMKLWFAGILHGSRALCLKAIWD